MKDFRFYFAAAPCVAARPFRFCHTHCEPRRRGKRIRKSVNYRSNRQRNENQWSSSDPNRATAAGTSRRNDRARAHRRHTRPSPAALNQLPPFKMQKRVRPSLTLAFRPVPDVATQVETSERDRPARKAFYGRGPARMAVIASVRAHRFAPRITVVRGAFGGILPLFLGGQSFAGPTRVQPGRPPDPHKPRDALPSPPAARRRANGEGNFPSAAAGNAKLLGTRNTGRWSPAFHRSHNGAG